MIKPHIRDILIIVLRLVAETRVDDLPTVVDALVENFEEDVVPIAYEVTVELVNLCQILDLDKSQFLGEHFQQDGHGRRRLG